MTPEQKKAYRNALKTRGLCTQGCGRPLVNAAQCEVCRIKKRDRARALVSSGLCFYACGRPVVRGKQCAECASSRSARSMATQQRHVTAGRCATGCGRLRVGPWTCQECSNKKRESTHGLAAGEYAKARALVPCCQSCGTQFGLESRRHNSACVDHNHTTGTPRGLLCSGCNVALGMLKEDPRRIRALADYIERVSK